MSAVDALAARGRERLQELEIAGGDFFAASIGYSEFLFRLLRRLGPEAGAALLAEARQPLGPADLRRLFAVPACLDSASERGLALIALRESAGLISTRASLLAASALARAAIAEALQRESTLPSGFVVFALGKLGGRELNFYSDLDIVLAAPPARSEREEALSLRGARHLIARLESVWNVDLRLRPFGRAGALVMSFPAMEAYFQNHGREWERYAWIKARPVAGNQAAGREFLERIRPFIYRRYLDYHVIEALREMKRQIVAEAGERPDDVKHGPGGIREIEFIVQAFQLVRGGREAALATPRLRAALGAAEKLGALNHVDARALWAAYVFLRRVENRLQIKRLTAEHLLPREDGQRESLAASLGFGDGEAFAHALASHRETVRRLFDAIFDLPSEAAGRAPAERFWRGEGEGEQLLSLARTLGFARPAEALEAVRYFKGSRAVRLMSARARVALDRLAPELIVAAAGEADSDAALHRLLNLLRPLTRRSAYLALLVERPQARERLAELVGKSPWIAERLAASPVALDELLDSRTAAPAGRQRLRSEFAALTQLADEPENASERFREINQVERLKIAAALVDGSLSERAIERRLSLVAEGAVRSALALATERMRARHGELSFDILTLAYGKLGSRELGFASDLDLVFVYEAHAEQSADGLAAELYLARLAQRAISLLTEPTACGALYEVDTRLRPEGAAGLLISRFDAWRRYQREKAWVWERQALLRARAVAGSPRLARAFHAERASLLGQAIDHARLRREMLAMRARVAASGPRRSGRASALIDGEFLTAWWVLEAVSRCQAASRYTGAAQLERLAACASEHPAAELAEALAVLRGAGNRAVLGLDSGGEVCAEACKKVAAMWARASESRDGPL
jgi:glutamate-ammonia-ligase adenylyltransferase